MWKVMTNVQTMKKRFTVDTSFRKFISKDETVS